MRDEREGGKPNNLMLHVPMRFRQEFDFSCVKGTITGRELEKILTEMVEMIKKCNQQKAEGKIFALTVLCFDEV